MREVGLGILPSWTSAVERHRGTPFSEAQRQWQLLRRGRYLEFNLLYDRWGDAPAVRHGTYVCFSWRRAG